MLDQIMVVFTVEEAKELLVSLEACKGLMETRSQEIEQKIVRLNGRITELKFKLAQSPANQC